MRPRFRIITLEANNDPFRTPIQNKNFDDGKDWRFCDMELDHASRQGSWSFKQFDGRCASPISSPEMREH